MAQAAKFGGLLPGAGRAMNFVSYSYLILFAVVLASRLTFGRRKIEPAFVALLTAVSALFYAWHVPSFLFILLTSAVVDYGVGRYLGGDGQYRRAVLLLSLAANLGLLVYFKYADFALEGLRSLAVGLGLHTTVPHLDLILPMGISFYTFASLSYTIDVYRGEIAPVRGFEKFFLFICFFPHLVAGPIVRASMFLPQMDRIRRPRLNVFNEGGFLIVRGLFLKVVCANHLAALVNRYWDQGYAPGGDSGVAVFAAMLFACQIFCDFEGYSSIARGTAYLLGYRLPLNFNNPYLAGSFKNFWERWHITLSQWLRDYLYIPLGGNRVSRPRTYLNLLLVMILGGLWHGASLTFVAWGALHGLALAAEKLLGLDRPRADRPIAVRIAWYFVAQAGVLAAWVFFRSNSFTGAASFLSTIAACQFAELPPQLWRWGTLAAAPLVLMHLRGFLAERDVVPNCGPREKAVLAALMLYAVLTCYGADSAFIYFQF
jgi:alginate O-acetyltransferase complex protein AlgI